MTGTCCHAGPRNHSSIMYPLNFEGVFIITLLYFQRSINLLISFHRTKGSTFVSPRSRNVKLAGKYLLSNDHRQYRNLLGHRLWGGTKLGHFITQLKNCISGWSKICHEKKNLWGYLMTQFWKCWFTLFRHLEDSSFEEILPRPSLGSYDSIQSTECLANRLMSVRTG